MRIDEVENGIVSGYQVLAGNPADTAAWIPALQQHQACFGRAPEMACGDHGFFSAKNEGARPWGKEGRIVANTWATSLGQAGRAAETALVSPRAALAGRD